MTHLIPAEFHGESIQLIEKDGVRWLTARDVGLCLGYSIANASKGILKVYERHIDEFTGEDSTTVKLTAVDGKERNTRIFSPSGCHLISFFANTRRAKDFRAWAKQVLVQARETLPAPAATPESQLEAHMATLAQGMHTILKQNQMTHKYISLLEMNQKGKRRIKPEDKDTIMQLRAEGMSQSDIARLLRISPASVNLIIHDKYPFAKAENARIGIGEVLEKMLDEEENQLKRLLSAGGAQ